MQHTIKTNSAIYTVSDTGLVFTESLIKTPIGGKGRKFSGEFTITRKPMRELAKPVNNRGYYSVRLAGKTHMVHRLVAQAFISNPLNKPFVNHKDGDKSNNDVSNLEWCTQKENLQHAFRTGLMDTEGRKNSIAALREHRLYHKLPDEVVTYIRNNFKKRCPNHGAQAMAEKFGVSTTTISYVVNFKKAYA